MSSRGQSSNPSSANFKSILDAALSNYKEKTGKELLNHPIATELQQCDSIDAILVIIQGQATAFQQVRSGDQRLMKRIEPVANALHTLSGTLGEAVGLVRHRDPAQDNLKCILNLSCRHARRQK